MRAALLCLAVILIAAPAWSADKSSPVGTWRTIDDETKTERSIVEVSLVNGELQGRVVKIFFRPDEPPNPVCEKCEGERKDKPVIGMTFLWGLKADSATDWVGGAILDPKNGKIYNAKLSVTEGGKELRVRGYIGTPILGRSQVWQREPD
jgi:uncharacterized protein (DUF2147 family)